MHRAAGRNVHHVCHGEHVGPSSLLSSDRWRMFTRPVNQYLIQRRTTPRFGTRSHSGVYSRWLLCRLCAAAIKPTSHSENRGELASRPNFFRRVIQVRQWRHLRLRIAIFWPAQHRTFGRHRIKALQDFEAWTRPPAKTRRLRTLRHRQDISPLKPSNAVGVSVPSCSAP